MNNNIQEDYCSYKLWKIFNKKGFYGKELTVDNKKHVEAANLKITHSLAIKWIRENFGIHIYSVVEDDKWNYGILIKGKYGALSNSVSIYTSSGEAIEAALLYTLKNLI